MARLILLRHGQSLWNLANRFTGWVDVPLSAKGIAEAQAAGQLLADMSIDVAFTSALVRAQQTALLALGEQTSKQVPVMLQPAVEPPHWADIHDQAAAAEIIPVHINAALNERYYGDLQGLNKQAARDQFGEEQVKKWRRGFHVCPPDGESLAQTQVRAWAYTQSHILPALEQGKNVLVAAHGNSLRAMVMKIEQLSEDEVLALELATGEPRLYDWQAGRWQRIDV